MQRFRARLRAGFRERSNGANGHAADGTNGNAHEAAPAHGAVLKKYLVCGMLRPTVKQISDAMSKARVSADILQLAPICSFNAFEFAYPQVYANDTFLLLDMGHLQSTVLIGSKKELVLVRSIDYGGKSLTQALMADGALAASAARVMMNEGDRAWRKLSDSLTRLAMEVRNSIGFFEGQHEENIHRIFVSGRPRPHGDNLANLER